MAGIKAIDRTTVHRICSGQVVLNLAIAVKELVENSLDAGATVIEVRFKEYGSELVEVTDNGSGVHPSNFEGLTLKHHTSKLREFSDLISVETFGFRGEALSSLCALSELSVITRHESEPCGTALVFDKNGHIIERKQHSRQVGTTVTLTNLFSTLPVRQKEFHKNLKREFNKMTQLLYAYCLVSTGVKITCVNQTKKGSRSTFMATQGCKTVKENISCIFGAKQLTNLLEIKQKEPSSEIFEELKLTVEDCSNFKLEGYISSCAHGAGRGSSDRQFYFINSRPCEPSKIIKQVNEVYHHFNVHQYPFVFLNINVTKGEVDVNVTPDKRQVFLTQEKLVLAIIKSSLLDLYEKIPSTYSLNNLSFKPATNGKLSETCVSPSLSKFDSWRHKDDKADAKRRFDSSINDGIPKKQIKIETGQTQKTLEAFSIKRNVSKLEIMKAEEVNELSNLEKSNCVSEDIQSESIKIAEESSRETDISSSVELRFLETVGVHSVMESNVVENSSVVNSEEPIKLTDDDNLPSSPLEKNIENSVCETYDEHVDNEHEKETIDTLSTKEKTPCRILIDEYVERGKKYVVFPSNIDLVKDSLKKRLSNELNSKLDKVSIRFHAAIDPSKNEQAENELSREISKDKFDKMEIIGQFNLGFIITKLGSDLFIIDQHATDEKYNFETLQKTTVISNQRLVNPQTLELTAANECVLIDNIEVFRKNGFEFEINEEAPLTKRIKLTAIPMSRNWVFGKDDIDELIFMLENCPHGRPTMRHLVNLELIKKKL